MTSVTSHEPADSHRMRADKTLYLARHGETVWNSVGRYQGGKDSPLTLRGREQASAAAKTLASRLPSSTTPVRAYVNPLGRAIETASIIVQSIPLDTVLEPRISEVSAGTWDGMSMDEIEMEYPAALAGLTRYDWYFRSPDGEAFELAFDRVSAWLKDVESPAIVVTHGVASRLIRGAYLGLSRTDMLQLPVPQDGLFCLSAGRSTLIPCR